MSRASRSAAQRKPAQPAYELDTTRIERDAPALAAAIAKELTRRAQAWKPFPDKADGTPHPQRLARESKADILGYGGAAGGGKSDLLLGTAGWDHYRSIIFRRVFPSLRGLVDRSRTIYNPDGAPANEDSYNESLHRWRFKHQNPGAQVEFGSLQYDRDVLSHQGQPRDFYGFDELTEFTEYQFRYVIGWNRPSSGDPRAGKRCRVVGTMNPPTTKEGEWVIRFFGPWLDPLYNGKRAKEGELRWFTTVAGKDKEMKGPDDFIVDEKSGDKIYPKSRTFIFARVQDNPVLMASGYLTTLQSLPEPLRSKLLYGDFMATSAEDPFQLFPTAWVKEAMARWAAMEEPEGPVDQLGIDVARGGPDSTVYTRRKGAYFCAQKRVHGSLTPDGESALVHAVDLIDRETKIGIDVVAVGTSPYDLGKKNKLKIVALNGAEKAEGQTAKAGGLKFYNKRALWHWKLREDLDPKSGIDLAIPDDHDLLIQLCAIKWELTVRGIKVRDKEETKVLIGRSPDDAESLIYAHASDYAGGASYAHWLRDEVSRQKDEAQQEKEDEAYRRRHGDQALEAKRAKVALMAALMGETKTNAASKVKDRDPPTRNAPPPPKSVAELEASRPKQKKKGSSFAEAMESVS